MLRALTYVLALDQGTSSSRALLFDQDGTVAALAQRPVPSQFPHPGWVEQDAADIWQTQRAVALEAVASAGVAPTQIAALGIANQRETVVVWDRATGEPIRPAIVWQDRRTAEALDLLREAGHEARVRDRTGLLLDPYFSASKLAWILDHVEDARSRAERGELACGTVDCWLQWQLSGGAVHATDATNASRTLLFDLHTGQWSEELLETFRIPPALLPRVTGSGEVVGEATTLFDTPLAMAARIGDQQAATLGQAITAAGQTKCTYGTGCFLLAHTGDEARQSASGLLTTVALATGGEEQGERTAARTFALEGSVFVGGALVQWMRDGLGLISDAAAIEALAGSVPDAGGVTVVPALTGLGAPYWDPLARGTITGITRGTTAAHLARAGLDGIALQVADVVGALAADLGGAIGELRVDGGAAANDLLMQTQADLLDVHIVRPQMLETTAWGAASLAGLTAGVWPDLAAVQELWQPERVFEPQMSAARRRDRLGEWQAAVTAAQSAAAASSAATDNGALAETRQDDDA